MNYLVTPASNAAAANQWVVDNLDPNGAQTFVPNRQDANGVQQCLISLPNNPSDFVKGMKAQFGYANHPDPALQPIPDSL